MNSALAVCLPFCLLWLGFTHALDSALAAPAVVELKVTTQGNNFVLSFSSAPDKKYQVYFSRDLAGWEPWGNAVKGTGDYLYITYDRTSVPSGYFKVAAEDLAVPVPLNIQGRSGNLVQLSFVSAADKKYQIYSSSDLANWRIFSDIIQGTGQRIVLEHNAGNAGGVFFLAETTSIMPVPNMVWIQPGTFLMGSPLTEKDRDLDEDPLTLVTFPHGFWMGKYEVTQRDYEALMGSNPSGFKGDPNLPVEQVTWKEAVAYCTRLTEIEFEAGRLPDGYVYRLPTEAEFEYACRAGTTTRYSFGDDLDYSQIGEYAWYGDNSGSTTHPVGQKKPNPFGLYDMHGNVWEWCYDYYSPSYPAGNVINPSGPMAGTSRVFRGGGWDYVASSCRSAFRNNVAPTRRMRYIGFRLVLSPVQP